MMSRVRGWAGLALLLLVAPRPVHSQNCPPGGCEFSSTTVLPPTTTTSTISPEDAFLLPLLDDIEQALKAPLPAVLSGSAFGRGRLKVKVWNINPFEGPDLLWVRGRARIHRAGAFRLKLHPQFPDGPVGLIRIVVRYTTKTIDLRRQRHPELIPIGPVCCDFGSFRGGGACRGGLDAHACRRLSGFFSKDYVCDASGDCMSAASIPGLPPITPGSCCDNVPSQPGVCGAPADESACVSAGGTFYPASVCQPSGACSPWPPPTTTTTSGSSTTNTTGPRCAGQEVVWNLPPGTFGGPACIAAGGGTCTNTTERCPDRDGVGLCPNIYPPACRSGTHAGTLRCNDGSYGQTCYCDVRSVCVGSTAVPVGFTW